MKKNPFKKDKKPALPGMILIFRWLLVLEAIELFLLGVYHFSLNKGPQLFNLLFSQWITGRTALNWTSLRLFLKQLVSNAASQSLLIALVESAVLFMLTVLALWAAIGFFRLWVFAWDLAMFIQGGALLTSLILYFVNKPLHINFLMVTGIFMVLYLNYADMRSFFESLRSNEEINQ